LQRSAKPTRKRNWGTTTKRAKRGLTLDARADEGDDTEDSPISGPLMYNAKGRNRARKLVSKKRGKKIGTKKKWEESGHGKGEKDQSTKGKKPGAGSRRQLSQESVLCVKKKQLRPHPNKRGGGGGLKETELKGRVDCLKR